MKENFLRILGHVRKWEGGNAVRVEEPGGGVSRGISLHAYRRRHPHATLDDLFNASDDEIDQIYREDYWNPIDGDHLPAGMDAIAMHLVVMLGLSGFHKLAVGVAPNDWEKLVVLGMHNKMHREETAWRFMKGWSDRFVSMFDLGRELTGMTGLGHAQVG